MPNSAERLIQTNSLLPIFPRSPLLSSRQTDWRSIYLEHHHQPAYETPEHRYLWHVVGIHLGRPVTTELRSPQGRIEKKRIIDGDICIFPANTRFWERSHGDAEFIDLHLEPTLIARTVCGDADDCRLTPVLAVRDPLIQQIGLALKTELEAAGERLYAESLAAALAVHLLRHYAAGARPLPAPTGGLPAHKLRQAIDYIEAHLGEALSVAAIAQTLRMSPFYFSRQFKQSTGLTPHQYVIQRRVDRAKQLLREGWAIADAACAVGFAHQSHLTRHFKRLLGTTPKAFLSS